jgi:hypothetical protein
VTTLIQDYQFGRIVVDGREYRSDVIVLPDRVKADWWRLEGHRLQVADLEHVLAAAPDVLIVGTGSVGLMRVDHEVTERLKAEGIEVVAARTREACEEYNRRCAEERVAAALHLTC